MRNLGRNGDQKTLVFATWLDHHHDDDLIKYAKAGCALREHAAAHRLLAPASLLRFTNAFYIGGDGSPLYRT